MNKGLIMEPNKSESAVPAVEATFGSEKKQYTPINLKPYYVYGRFPILLFMGTLGVAAYLASLLYDAFVK
jgi:hypothetical protein